MLRCLDYAIDWLSDMIARWINHLCSWWCTVPYWPLWTAAIGLSGIVSAYLVAWSR